MRPPGPRRRAARPYGERPAGGPGMRGQAPANRLPPAANEKLPAEPGRAARRGTDPMTDARDSKAERPPEIQGKLRYFNRVLMSYREFQQATRGGLAQSRSNAAKTHAWGSSRTGWSSGVR